MNRDSLLKFFFEAIIAYLSTDDDEFVDKEHIVLAAMKRFGVSQNFMDISEK